MLYIILAFPSGQYYVNYIFFLINVSRRRWSVTHLPNEYEDWTISSKHMITLCYKVGCTQSSSFTLCVSVLKHLNFGVKLLSEIPKNFFFAKGITVEVKLKVMIESAVSANKGTDLLERSLLAGEIFFRSCKCVIHIACRYFLRVHANHLLLDLFEHDWSIPEITSM